MRSQALHSAKPQQCSMRGLTVWRCVTMHLSRSVVECPRCQHKRTAIGSIASQTPLRAQLSALPKGDSQTTRDDKRAATKDRQIGANTEKHQVDDLGYHKK